MKTTYRFRQALHLAQILHKGAKTDQNSDLVSHLFDIAYVAPPSLRIPCVLSAALSAKSRVPSPECESPEICPSNSGLRATRRGYLKRLNYLISKGVPESAIEIIVTVNRRRYEIWGNYIDRVYKDCDDARIVLTLMLKARLTLVPSVASGSRLTHISIAYYNSLLEAVTYLETGSVNGYISKFALQGDTK